MTDALDRVMLSLPTGHYVNTYAPLEKKAEDLLNLSGGTPLIVASAAVGAVTSGRRPGTLSRRGSAYAEP